VFSLSTTLRLYQILMAQAFINLPFISPWNYSRVVMQATLDRLKDYQHPNLTS